MTKWSFSLGRILGIQVYVHFTFFLLLAFVGFTEWMRSSNPAAAVIAVLFLVSLFGCVLLHEFGHALAARGYGIHTRDIVLLPIGGVARMERMPSKPLQELWVAIAGPLVNVVIAGGLFVGLTLKGTGTFSLDPINGSLAQRLLVVNIFLVLFNLLPAFPMDGGRVLRALLALRLSYAHATRIAARIGQAMAFLFGFVGLFSNPMLLLIALFVWVGAAQESAAIEAQSSVSGALVREAMMTRYRTLSPEQSLGDAARLLLAGSQQDFPVLDGSHFIGMLPRQHLFRALQEHGERVSVARVMVTSPHIVDADSPLEEALSSIRPEGSCTTCPVFQNGEMVGLLTAENVGEFFIIRAALESRRDGESSVPPVIETVQLYPPQARRTP